MYRKKVEQLPQIQHIQICGNMPQCVIDNLLFEDVLTCQFKHKKEIEKHEMIAGSVAEAVIVFFPCLQEMGV